MMRLVCSILFLACLAALPLHASAQNGTIEGTIVDAETEETLVGANVRVMGTAQGASTNVDGRFRLTNVPAGDQTLRITYVGYQAQDVSVTVRAGETSTLSITLTPSALLGDEVVVTGTRQAEKRLEAPVTIETIQSAELERAGGTFLTALSGLKGVDFVSGGINAQGISARGFNNQFNTRMLSMTDGRVAQLPGTGLPQGNFLPTASLDVQTIEVVVGPASALYGPNAHTGVVNVITKTPWDESGVGVALRGGQQDLIDGTIRAAGTVNDRFGWKVTGQYLDATDFAPSQEGVAHNYGSSLHESQLIDDYSISSVRAEGTLYYRFADGWTAQGGYSFSENDNFGLTNNGRNHIRGWQVQQQYAQVSSNNWFGQVTRTTNDAGDTYQLNAVAVGAGAQVDNGVPLDEVDFAALRAANAFVDRGELIDSELQYSNTIGGVGVTTGLQLRRYNPDSEGTFLADAAGEDISATEFGGYLQLDRRFLDNRLRLVGAARVDDHSNYDTQFSPKIAAVYSVTPSHNVRIGFNRAFKSPTVLESNLFINIPGLGNVFLGNIDGYTVQDADGNLLRTIDPLSPEEVNALELGYKGVFANRLLVDVVAHNSWYNNFISPLTNVANPAAGTFGFDDTGSLVDGSGFLWTYFNFGEATVRGADIGLEYYASDRFSFNGNVSLIELADFTAPEGQADLLLNVPTTKVKGGATMRDVGFDNYSISLSGRWQSEYEFRSGYWNSEVFFADNDGKIPSRFVADLTLGYTIPQQNLSLRASISNLFDNDGVDVLGAPPQGRFVWLGLQYQLPGLNR